MTKKLGNEGEALAADFLKKKGLEVIERNFRAPSGEVDIVARDGNTVVFVEVKTRAQDLFGHPVESVDARKRQRIKNAALFYLARAKRELPVRFDVIAIRKSDAKNTRIEHFVDAWGD